MDKPVLSKLQHTLAYVLYFSISIKSKSVQQLLQDSVDTSYVMIAYVNIHNEQYHNVISGKAPLQMKEYKGIPVFLVVMNILQRKRKRNNI